MIGHEKRLEKSLKRENKKRSTRSPMWRHVEHAFVSSHPTCAACGAAEHLQVHHVLPFHQHPELELDPTNLIVLCMGASECHVIVGHGDNFKAYNPNVREDAKRFLSSSEEERKLIAESAKSGRLLA
jgi:5-methylcytosine-specific restriction protein A